MEKKCFICKKSGIKFLLNKDGYDLWHCKKCKLNFIYPQPTEKELQYVYSLDGGYSHSSKGFDKNIISTNKNPKINFLLKMDRKKILDVGCASGSFVYAAKMAGLDPTGIDIDKDSIKFGQKEGLDLRHGSIYDMKFKQECFDAIVLGDIIEHVKDPKKFLKECLRILKKNGILIISTPNTNSFFPMATKWIYEKVKIMWSHSTPPYHLFDFSDENLSSLLKDYGLSIKTITYSKIPLMYSIYHTGYFNELRKNMNGTSGKDVMKGLIKSFNLKMIKGGLVVFLYGLTHILDKLFCKKGDQMIIYSMKNN